MTNEQLNFIRDAYLHQKEQRSIFDTKAWFLIGVSGVIFALSMNRIERLGFFIISVSALFALILALWTISFPFRRAPGEKFSLLCWSGFKGLDKKEYEEKMREIISSNEKIAHEYIKEIYALSRYSVEPKSKMVRVASLILTLSLLSGLFLLILGI